MWKNSWSIPQPNAEPSTLQPYQYTVYTNPAPGKLKSILKTSPKNAGHCIDLFCFAIYRAQFDKWFK